MRKKLFGRLLSLTLSAVLALSSGGVQVYAMDGMDVDIEETDEENNEEPEDTEEEESQEPEVIKNEEITPEPEDETGDELYGDPGVYEITFDVDGKTTAPEKQNTGSNGKLTSLPSVPTVIGYTTDGKWYKEDKTNVVSEDTVFETAATVYAIYTENTYTFSFDANANGSNPPSSIDKLYTAAIGDIAAPTPAQGYTFNGWNTLANGTGLTVTSTTKPSDILALTADKYVLDGTTFTIYATYQQETPAETFTVSFNSNGGSEVADITGVVSGSKITAPTAPTLAGYTFDAWYKEAALSNAWVFSTDTVTAATTLYAKWTAKAVNVTFNKNAGDGYSITAPATTKTVTIGSAFGEIPEITKTAPEGFEFDKWTIGTASDSTEVTAAYVVAATDIEGTGTDADVMNVYAQWKAVTTPSTEWTVTFDVDGVTTAVAAQTTVSRKLASLPAVPDKNGYKGAWYLKDGTEWGAEVTTATTFSEDKVVFKCFWHMLSM